VAKVIDPEQCYELIGHCWQESELEEYRPKIAGSYNRDRALQRRCQHCGLTQERSLAWESVSVASAGA
jgi:hypothetical protein